MKSAQKASRKMYNDQIENWVIGKNIKDQQMRAIIRKQAERYRAGKKSNFIWHGSEVPAHKIARYRRHRKLSIEIEALKLRASTPPGLICYTPLASPLTTLRNLEIPERIARLCQDYIDSALNSSIWTRTKDRDCTNTKNLEDSLYKALIMSACATKCWTQGDATKKLGLLHIALTLGNSIPADAPDKLEILNRAIYLRIVEAREPDTAFTILQHFVRMSTSVLGQDHPLTQICTHLVQLETKHLIPVLSIAQQTQTDRFTRRSDNFNAWGQSPKRSLSLRRSLAWNALDLMRSDNEICTNFLEDPVEALPTLLGGKRAEPRLPNAVT